MIAINDNRVPGRVPADSTRPAVTRPVAASRIHTKHHSGSGGSVTIPDAAVVQLQRPLVPALHPVILMGTRVAARALSTGPQRTERIRPTDSAPSTVIRPAMPNRTP